MGIRTGINTTSAAEKLAALVLKHTGTVITPAQVEVIVRSEWELVAAYAHRIHRDVNKGKSND